MGRLSLAPVWKWTGKRQMKDDSGGLYQTDRSENEKKQMDLQNIQKIEEQLLGDGLDVAVSEMEDSRMTPRFQARATGWVVV